MGWFVLKWLLLGIFTNGLIHSESNFDVGMDGCRLFGQTPCGRGCAPLSWLCDGDEDCPGGTDERCDEPCHDKDGWKCKNGKCISFAWVCNGYNDCMDGSDEMQCEYPKCGEGKILCQDGIYCIDRWELCNGIVNCKDNSDEANCLNTTGIGTQWQCPNNRCVVNNSTCNESRCGDSSKFCEGNLFILAAENKSLTTLDLNNRMFLSVSLPNEIVAVAHDSTKDAFYWVDVEGTIFSLVKNSSSQIYADNKGVNSIAFDWLTRLIYWTNHIERKICAGMPNGSGFVTVLEKNVKPEQLVLHPVKSCMFWVNQRDVSTKARIEMAGMDGSERKVVVVLASEAIGLTLDYPAERLYWFSRGDERIETMKIDGSERFFLPDFGIRQPLGFTVYEDWFYWSEFNQVQRISCHSEEEKQVLLEHVVISTLIVVHELQHQQSNHRCQKAGCSHLCLLSPMNIKGYKCACPRGMIPAAGKCEISTLDTWEIQQDPESTLECDRTFFLCKDGTECVSFEYLCDGDKDCPDGSDEMDCSELCDEPDAFQCLEGITCIQGQLRCDGIAQCPDESDENNCFQESDLCGFWCDNHHRCIPSHWICDGSEDCNDESDELECGCGNDDFVCDDGQCISSAFRCDLKYDCRDMSDERNCVKPKEAPCQPEEVMCPVSKECIIKEWWCDDYVDCGDGMDEQNCEFSMSQCREFQWMCNSSQCIPHFWHCDGLKDCKDGSDEMTCQQRPCKSFEFQCTTSECINMNLVCNGKFDCSDASDEGGDCDAQECINCTNVCYTTPSGPKCGCADGFKLVPDLHTCVDIDECKELSTRPCSQICLNENGTYNCSCHPHYLLNNDRQSCKVTGPEPVLLVSIHHDVLLYGLHSDKKDIIPAIAKGIMFPLDYYWKEQVIFWSDTYSQSINWMKLDQHDKGMLIKGVQSDCIAIDWVGRNLYWTDGAAGQILAINLNSTWHETKEYVVVIGTAIDQPLSLVLQPINGLMYWAEIGSEPHIERAGMDGTNRKVIIKHGLGWPTSLTLDLSDWKLFWADGKLHCIGVSNLDGTGIKFFQLAQTRRPFGVAVFEDNVYWSDVELRSVQKADKRLGKNRTVLLKHDQPYSLKVMHEVLQPMILNPCEKMGCSHFCLLGPGFKGSCHCGPEMLLANDNLTCVKSVEPFLLMISPTVITQIYLKHLQHDKGLKALSKYSINQLINKKVSSVDYIWNSNMVYFADSDEGLVGELVLGPNVSSWQKILQLDNEIISLTVDWLGRNLYWITSKPCVIEVASINGLYRLVLIENLNRSTSLVLHPPSGIMCFSEWGSGDQGDGPRIECSSMDGQKRKVVWKKCSRPTGLVLAESGTRLYWIDLDHGVIDSVRLDGSEFEEVKAGLDVHSVFAYGENVLIWTTVHNGYTKLWYGAMGQEQQWFDIEQEIIGLKVYSRQQGSNFCSEENGGCNHLCLAYHGGRTCRCSAGYHLVNSACEIGQCPQQTWPCLDGFSCILNEQVCDGEKHCVDGSDEMKCDMWKRPIQTSDVFPTISTPETLFSQKMATSRWFPVSPTNFKESWFPPTDTIPVTSSSGISLHSGTIAQNPVANQTDGDFNATGVGRSSSCTAELCNMRGKCYVVDDSMMCKCQEDYTGRFCEDQVAPEITIPLILGILVVVLLVAIGVLIFKRRAGKRKARNNLQLTAAGQRNQIMMDEAFVEVPEEPRASS